MDFLDILLERVIRSKLNKKAEWVKAYLGYVWFGPQLEKILRASPLKPNIILSLFCVFLKLDQALLLEILEVST